MKEILDLKKKERLFIEKNIADIDREELKETYKVDDKTLDKIIQDGAHEGSPYITIPNFDLEVIDLVFSVHNYLTNTELEYGGQDICSNGHLFESPKSRTNVRSNKCPPTFLAIF